MELKEAIEILLDFKWRDVAWGKMDEAIDTVIQTLEELQEEHELYKDKIVLLSDEEYRKVIDAAQKDCISKDKIKEKIKELYEDKNSKYYDMFLEQRDIEKTISILNELLKGE